MTVHLESDDPPAWRTFRSRLGTHVLVLRGSQVLDVDELALPSLDTYLASRQDRFATWKPSLSHALLVAPPRESTHPSTRRAGPVLPNVTPGADWARRVSFTSCLGSGLPRAKRPNFGALRKRATL